MAEELKPCPFCGGKAEIHSDGAFWKFHVECANVKCGGTTGTVPTKTVASAIKAWNTRAGEGKVEEAVKAEREACAQLADEYMEGETIRDAIRDRSKGEGTGACS